MALAESKSINEIIIPDYAEAIVAYRGWLSPHRAEADLTSVTYRGIRWTPGATIVAQCNPLHSLVKGNRQACIYDRQPRFNYSKREYETFKAEDKCPHFKGKCGIYSLKSSYAGELQSRDMQWIIGEVEIWGKIVEHQQGYRSQYARLKSIQRVPGYTRDLNMWLKVKPHLEKWRDYLANTN